MWTTFHEYQWDLNYANPAVFRAMLGTMLTLANDGIRQPVDAPAADGLGGGRPAP